MHTPKENWSPQLFYNSDKKTAKCTLSLTLYSLVEGNYHTEQAYCPIFKVTDGTSMFLLKCWSFAITLHGIAIYETSFHYAVIKDTA